MRIRVVFLEVREGREGGRGRHAIMACELYFGPRDIVNHVVPFSSACAEEGWCQGEEGDMKISRDKLGRGKRAAGGTMGHATRRFGPLGIWVMS